MGKNRTGTRRGSSKPPGRSFLTIIPIRLFWQRDDADAPIVGILRRMSPRAVALFAYLSTRMDQEDGRITGDPARWSRPEEHGRDPATVRAALRELVGTAPVGGCVCRRACECPGERFALLQWLQAGELYASESYFAERLKIRGARNQNRGGEWAWCQFRAALVRGGPWQALTDGARKLWLFLRTIAPEDARHTRSGDAVGSETVSRAKIVQRTGLSERCVTELLPVLERVGLVRVTRARRGGSGRFLVNVYRVIGELTRQIRGRRVDFSRRVADQIAGLFPGNAREVDAQLVALWWSVGRRSNAPPVRLRRLLPA